MAKNRKAAEAFILKYIEKLLPNSPNTKMYQDMFAKMSDTEFDKWINNVGTGAEDLIIVAPNLADYRLNVERNLEIADELGHEFFQRIWVTADDGTRYLTPNKHLVYKLPVRRQAQLLVKKISIPKDNNTVDVLTGQATGDSKGAKISYVELQILAAKGLDKSLNELVKLRGGDAGGFKAMNTLISRNGEVSQEEVEPYTTGVESNATFKAYLTSAHLESDL